MPSDARAELLATIEESTDRLDALVENLLSMSRPTRASTWPTCAANSNPALPYPATSSRTGIGYRFSSDHNR